MERVRTADSLPGEIFDEIFGAGSPRAFSHYQELEAFLNGEGRGSLDGVELMDDHQRHIHSGEDLPFITLARLKTASSLVAFGYQSEDLPRPLTIKISKLSGGNGEERARRERRLLASLRGNPLWVQTLPEYDMVEYGIVMESLWNVFGLPYLCII